MTRRADREPPGGEWWGALKRSIRDELRLTGFTRRDLAAHLGLTEKHVSQVLSGKVAGSPQTIEDMARAVGLDVTVRWGPPTGGTE